MTVESIMCSNVSKNEELSASEQEDAHLSNHTLAMRKVLHHCKDQLLDSPYDEFVIIPDAQTAARSLQSFRKQNADIREIDILERMLSGEDFRRRYINANRPCCIRDPEWAHMYFGLLLSRWRQNGKTNIEWFEQSLGRETTVPVRYDPGEDVSVVDEDGRAAECETRNMKLSEWIQLLNDESKSTRAHFYLKDWHLQLSLPDNETLYSCPEQFDLDLLNRLFLGFTDGDYRFTYWGPNGSQTSLHSDVLNSFSWSFNVQGAKDWTFFVPTNVESDDCEPVRKVVIRQECGECIFVPAGLKHHVVNIGETLSVNHNWITAASCDLTWECMCAEMEAVALELGRWGNFDCGAHESMLRGCIGLDVTAFFLMLLLGVAETKQNRQGSWERCFELTRLGDMLRILLSDVNFKLRERLEATLASQHLALLAFEVANQAAASIN